MPAARPACVLGWMGVASACEPARTWVPTPGLLQVGRNQRDGEYEEKKAPCSQVASPWEEIPAAASHLCPLATMVSPPWCCFVPILLRGAHRIRTLPAMAWCWMSWGSFCHFLPFILPSFCHFPTHSQLTSWLPFPLQVLFPSTDLRAVRSRIAFRRASSQHGRNEGEQHGSEPLSLLFLFIFYFLI